MICSKLSRFVVLAAVALPLVSLPALATTFYVANNGVDSATCGKTKSHACRSISETMARSLNGDTIIVGPGIYGDLNHDGVLGNSPGEEIGSPNCTCMIWVGGHSVKLISSQGAQATFLDARTLNNISVNVQIQAPNVIFGEPGKGFTVTGGTKVVTGVYVAAVGGITVAGNEVLGLGADVSVFTDGIQVDANAGITQILGNQVIGWTGVGIVGSLQTTISNNVVSLAVRVAGIVANGNSVSGNIVTGNASGIQPYLATAVTGNNIVGNGIGIGVYDNGNTSTAEQNNIVGNDCGVYALAASAGFNAENNYWGASTGPGSIPPADGICTNSASVLTSPYATIPFTVPVKLVP